MIRHEPPLQGRCLCGAVAVTVAASSGEISACHCTFCTRWGGGLQLGIEVPRDAVTVTGPVATHRSSRLAERAWCRTCGAALWFAYVTDRDAGYFEVSPGLFENAGGAVLTRVVYADRHPTGYWLAGEAVTRIDRAEYEAGHPHLDEEV